MQIPQKKDALYVIFLKVTFELRVPLLAMVLDELRNFELRPVELDFIAKTLFIRLCSS
jgi:hypothetical protein